jgi:hypothetical protein
LLLFLLIGTLIMNAPGNDLHFVGKSMSASLVELYSSEGCSSCPPAETWLNQLKTKPNLWTDLFPVDFHVNYWDNLGWPDRFATESITQRQRDYATRLATDLYTPEFLVNGREWRHWWVEGGNLPTDAAQKSGILTLMIDPSSRISATYVTGGATSAHPLSLNVALLGFDIKSNVTHGENAGSVLTHDFVVLGFGSSAMTAADGGKFQAALSAPHSTTNDKPGAIVAWVSLDDGTILQIAGGWLPAHTASN